MFTFSENAAVMKKYKETGLPTVTRITSSREYRTWRDNVHLHDNEVELHLIKQGSTTITIHNHDFIVHAGDIIAINPGLLHMVVSDNPVYIYTIRIFQQADSLLPDDFIVKPDICPVTTSGDYFSYLLDIMNALAELGDKGISDHSCLCNILGAALYTTYKKIFESVTATFTPPKSSLATTILQYINDHYSDNITLNVLAGNFYVSPSYISGIFKREFNISPINYLINRRICEAKWYLINTNTPISEISRIVGYENTYHFSKLFTKRSNISPERFREINTIL